MTQSGWIAIGSLSFVVLSALLGFAAALGSCKRQIDSNEDAMKLGILHNSAELKDFSKKINGNLEDIRDRLTAGTGQMSALNEAVGTLKTQMGKVQTQMTSIQSEVSFIKAKVDGKKDN